MDWGPQLKPVDWNFVKRETFKRAFLDPPSPEPGDADAARRERNVRVDDGKGLPMPRPVSSFVELGLLPEYALQALQENGIHTPTPIQAQALPLVLAGHDVVGIAQTGSGKTLAFLLPAVVHMEDQPPLQRSAATPIVLVLAPTRELAVQICDEARKVLRLSVGGRHPWGCGAVCLYGGGDKLRQRRSLSQGAHVVVATPGRLMDFVATGVLSLERVTFFVLDEADRMLDMGFHADVAAISGQVRPERQVLFFSATWSPSVQELATGLCRRNAQLVRISVGQPLGAGGKEPEPLEAATRATCQARPSIVQEVVVVDFPAREWERQAREKRRLLEDYLRVMLDASKKHKILVFVSQKGLADELCEALWKVGFKAGAMHGGKPQDVRLRTLEQFRTDELQLLVATDVLGRGIDIPSVSHVVVYDMGSVDDYVHRIGRTARGEDAGGCALVFFEYYYKMPEIAGELIGVLEASGQPVPQGLRRVADEVARGDRRGRDFDANKGTVAGTSLGVQGDWDRHLMLCASKRKLCPGRDDSSFVDPAADGLVLHAEESGLSTSTTVVTNPIFVRKLLEAISFWSFVVAPGCPRNIEARKGQSFHISQACLDLGAALGRAAQVSLEHDGTEYAIARLKRGKQEWCPLDLFIASSVAKITVNGRGKVHLMGYCTGDEVLNTADVSYTSKQQRTKGTERKVAARTTSKSRRRARKTRRIVAARIPPKVGMLVSAAEAGVEPPRKRIKADTNQDGGGPGKRRKGQHAKLAGKGLHA